MTKVLIYKQRGLKAYGIVAPNGVKKVSCKSLAIKGAGMSAMFQLQLFGHFTEAQFRNKHEVIGSFMVKHAE